MAEALLKPTMTLLARKAGVSTMTVSRALGGTGRIDPDTRSRIVQMATEAGYRPNSAARAMQTGKFHCVSLLLSTVDGRSTLPADLLRGVQEELLVRDMHLNVSMLPDEALVQKWGMPSALRRQMCDGLLINYTHAIPTKLAEAIRRHALPSVWLNNKQPRDAVYPDDFNAAVQLTEKLIAVGHRRIAYADFGHRLSDSPAYEHYSVTDRLRGYEHAMRGAGLMSMLVTRLEGPPASDSVGRSFNEVMALSNRPTAFVTYGISHVNGVAYSALQAGLRVPEDLSIVTFDAMIPKIISKEVSAMLVPNESIGRTAMAMLTARIQRAESAESVALPLEFHSGQTIAPPPGG